VAPEGHVLVTVAATCANGHDLASLRGINVRPEQFPMVLGCDIAGWDPDGNEVVVAGSYGDPDAGFGDETMDPARRLVSEHFAGSFALRTIVPRRNLVPKPAWLSFHEAACLNVAWGTAYRMLFTRAGARPGESVLVQGAGGGVATAAIMLARAAGLHVVASSRSAAKRERALAIGAHEVIETGGRVARRVDLVVDTVGAATWDHSLRAVRPGGRIVTAGATTGAPPALDLARVFYRQISIIGSSSVTRVEVERMLTFMGSAGLRPVVDSVFPVSRIGDAFRRMEHPDLFGRVVIDLAEWH
jgi:NADPH:quinone reductase-like Zn-dependent oxidoreductase